MEKIPLGRSGLFALVDDEDLAVARQFSWRPHRRSGLIHARAEFLIEGKRVRVFLHRILMKLTAAERSIEVDHRNGDGLDCRRANLRVATRAENARNRVKRIFSRTSPYKGVRPRGTMWASFITLEKKVMFLGVYATPEEAARAYDAAAVKHHGEFARLNFPPIGGT